MTAIKVFKKKNVNPVPQKVLVLKILYWIRPFPFSRGMEIVSTMQYCTGISRCPRRPSTRRRRGAI